MNKTLILFLLLLFTSACKKKDHGGAMKFKMLFTTSAGKVLKSRGVADTLHAGYGDYITSITPYHFSGKFKMLGFQDAYDLGDVKTNMLGYIDGNLSPDDSARYANFSQDALVSFSPGLTGIQDDHGLFTGETINFMYFYFDAAYFYQELTLPAQYNTVKIDMFNRSYGNGNFKYNIDSVKKNNTLRIDYYPFISKVFKDDNYWPSAYLFGNCDSTYIFNLEKKWIPTSKDNLFVGGTNQPIVRIHNYNVVSIKTPIEGETVELLSTLSFDTRNLIQIYAGADNIPYTSDDVFTYAPKFWERMKAHLNVQ